MDKKNLEDAKRNKKDEFYTQMIDIEKELKEYKPYFKDKVIYCNCDNPEFSNFWKYFELNFEYLEIKKLVATHYEVEIPSYKLELIRIETGIKRIKTPLEQNGDFRSEECIEILKEADIVVTNPPFSLFREFVAQLVEYDKKFIIMGNVNAITYKEIFSLIKNNQVWLGYSIHSGDREFRVPNDYPLNASGYREDEYGNKYIRVKGVRWYTNLDYKERHEDLVLYKKYNEKEYPKYVNYEAINVDKTKDIPIDYDGVIGVPITFMDKYNPEQFEIIGLGKAGSCEFTSKRKMEILDKNGKPTGKYSTLGILYRKYDAEKDKKPSYRDIETGELYSSIYARILIKYKGDNKNE